MQISPLALQKAQFTRVFRGYSPQEVDDLVALGAEALAGALGDREAALGKIQELETRLQQTEERERNLHDTLLKAQRLSEEIISNAQREAQLLVKEAEHTADKIVNQAMEQASHIESRINALRQQRRELHLTFKNTLDLFAQVLVDDREDERTTATVHRLPLSRQERAER